MPPQERPPNVDGRDRGADASVDRHFTTGIVHPVVAAEGIVRATKGRQRHRIHRFGEGCRRCRQDLGARDGTVREHLQVDVGRQHLLQVGNGLPDLLHRLHR